MLKLGQMDVKGLMRSVGEEAILKHVSQFCLVLYLPENNKPWKILWNQVHSLVHRELKTRGSNLLILVRGFLILFLFLCPFDLQYLLFDSCNWIYPLCQLVRFLIYQFVDCHKWIYLLCQLFRFFTSMRRGWGEQMRPPSPGVTLSGKVRMEQVNRLTVNICFELCPLYATLFYFISCIFTLFECWCTLPKKCFKCYGVSSINLCWIFSNRSHDGLFPR